METTARVTSLQRWAIRWAPWVAIARSGVDAGALAQKAITHRPDAGERQVRVRTGSDVGRMGAPTRPDHHAFGQ